MAKQTNSFGGNPETIQRMPMTPIMTLGGGYGLNPNTAAAGSLNETVASAASKSDTAFLRTMIPHYQTAIDAAQSALQSGGSSSVKALAAVMVSLNQQHMDYMKQLLAAAGGNP